MNVYYVNQDISYTGIGHAGTPDDPFSWDDFYPRVIATGNPDDAYYIKGSHTLPLGGVNINIFSVIDSWELINPWKWVKTDDYYLQLEGGGILKNGIIFNEGVINAYTVSFVSMWISAGSGLLENNYIKGCTIANNFVVGVGSSSLLLVDTVMRGEIMAGAPANVTTFKNTIITGEMANAGNFVDDGENQENWDTTGIVWPIASDSKASYNHLKFKNNFSTQGSGEYSEYPNGLFGTPRRDLGAFYFSLILYADFDKITSGVGTEADPFSWENFYDRVKGNTPQYYYDEYLVKGTKTITTDSITFNSFYSIKRWIREPWRISMQTPTKYININPEVPEIQSILEGGIIYSTETIVVGRTDFYTCWFESVKQLRFVHDEPINFYGSTLLIRGGFVGYNNSIITIKDCVLLLIGILNNIGSSLIRFRTSACNKNENDFVDFKDAQTFDGSNQMTLKSLETVAWPSWGNSKLNFAYEIVKSIINIISGPYTNYETGLYKESRYGIGAFYFNIVLKQIIPGLITIGQNWKVKFAGNSFSSLLIDEQLLNHPEYCEIGKTYFFDDFFKLNDRNYSSADLSNCYVDASYIKLKTTESTWETLIENTSINCPKIPENDEYVFIEVKSKISSKGELITNSEYEYVIMNVELQDKVAAIINGKWLIKSVPAEGSGTILSLKTEQGNDFELINPEESKTLKYGIKIFKNRLERYINNIKVGERIFEGFGTITSMSFSIKGVRNEINISGNVPGCVMETDYVYIVGDELPNTCEGV